ncbi:hypothetical protein BREVNS_1947 [Brevinematales bacterium NS]|nr:hypothetical protein BREVNS_1947 [Brevinematales bacterium NS]
MKGKLGEYEIELVDDEIVPGGGISLFYHLLRQETKLAERLKRKKHEQFSDMDIVVGMTFLLAMAKPHFCEIETLRGSEFFSSFFERKEPPSEEILRQRLDEKDDAFRKVILEENNHLIAKKGRISFYVEEGPSSQKRMFVPLDIDTSPFDNSETKKEGVSRTYTGVYGYSPIFAYLGEKEGFCIHAELRKGSAHMLCDGGKFIRESIQKAKQILEQKQKKEVKILVRMDSAADSEEIIRLCQEEGVDFIIKKNPRQEDLFTYVEMARNSQTAICKKPRDGKTVYRDRISVRDGLYLVYEVVLREADPDGKVLLFPEVEFSGYWTSIPNVEEVIKLYRGHATSEQFHSEFKTDMGLERFPSGKFETNHTVLVLAILTFNILKLIGLSSFGHYPPESRGLYRLRIRTIIQDLIYLAIRFVKKGEKKIVQLSRKWTFSLIFWETVVSPT